MPSETSSLPKRRCILSRLRLAALVSGSGSNLQSIIDAIAEQSLPAEIVHVVASKHGLPAEERAIRNQLSYTVVSRKEYNGNCEAMSAAIADLLEPLAIDLILLCGFLSFLSEAFVERYQGRIMNIHPSLLPAFGGRGAYGIRVHQAVIDYGAKISGCTVMFVDAGEDTGPIILQKALQVHQDETSQSLADRVMQLENVAYPEAVLLFAEGRLHIDGRKVRIRERRT